MKWIKWIEEFPPYGETILIAMYPDNVGCYNWIYDVCEWYGGDPDEISNWNNKLHSETPVYWCYINEPKKI